MNPYAVTVLESLRNKVPWETEFLNCVEEVFSSISLVLDNDQIYQEYGILENLVEPDRAISFRVPWRDDRGKMQVNTGYRVEFNNTLGPYKGGLRFHSSVTQSILKFLGFEQIFKNSLTGLSIGGGKGGSDFNPRGKSDTEVMNFCHSFMLELSTYIGPQTDIPAGDIGVGTREIGYLFGAYKRITKQFDGTLTGKAEQWGGSILRPEATGYGVVYFLDEMLKKDNVTLDGKSVAVSGFGNVAWGAVKKVNELGGKVVTLSGPDGFVHDPDGIVGEKVDYMIRLRMGAADAVKGYADKFGVKFYEGKKPWDIPVDVALPCATQNEVSGDDVRNMIKNGVQYLVEGANLPLGLEAQNVIVESKIKYAPGKAANAGGVSTSLFEMAQNASLMKWTSTTVDKRLREVMVNIHEQCHQTAEEYGQPDNYLLGANIAGFKRVADAMIDQGMM